MATNENDPSSGSSRRPPSPHDVSPRTIAIIFGVMLAGLAIGMLLVMPHYGPRNARQRSGLGHVIPTSMIGRETNGMMWIPGGTFVMGSALGAPDESPEHEITLSPFWMDKTEVTNQEFQKFVDATGYVTQAEQKKEGVESSESFGSLILQPQANAGATNAWKLSAGANWRYPYGPDSSIAGRENFPVVHISWEDASAFAQWAGKRLPTEAEWEYAARGGLHLQPYIWGSEKPPFKKPRANLRLSSPPTDNAAPDRLPSTVPVATFEANGYGLFDMAGNVWEWCADIYRADFYQVSPRNNPRGPTEKSDAATSHVLRGGSYLTDEISGHGLKPSQRSHADRAMTRADIGFRCVKDGY